MRKVIADTKHTVSALRVASLCLTAVWFLLLIPSCSRSPAPKQPPDSASNVAAATSPATSTQPAAQEGRSKSSAELLSATKQLVKFYRQTLPLGPEDKPQLAGFVEAYWPYCQTMDYIAHSIRCQVALLKNDEAQIMSALIAGRLSKDFADLYNDALDLGPLDALRDKLQLPPLAILGEDDGAKYEIADPFKAPAVRPLWMKEAFLRRIALDKVRNDDILRVKRMLAALRQRDSILQTKSKALAAILSQLQAAGIDAKTCDSVLRSVGRGEEFWQIARRGDLPDDCQVLVGRAASQGNPWHYPQQLADIEARFAELVQRLTAEEQQLTKAAAP